MPSRFAVPARSRPLETGDIAPDFELRHTFDRSLQLSDLCASGPVLLVFYVFDFGHI